MNSTIDSRKSSARIAISYFSLIPFCMALAYFGYFLGGNQAEPSAVLITGMNIIFIAQFLLRVEIGMKRTSTLFLLSAATEIFWLMAFCRLIYIVGGLIYNLLLVFIK